MCFESPKGIVIPRDMVASFAVARFARDSEFGHVRIPFITGNKTGLALRYMTIHAGAIPRAYRVIFFRVRRHEKGLRNRRPHFFGDNVGEWELVEGAALAGLEPENLQIVRTGEKNYLARRAVFAACRPDPNNDFIGVAFQFVFTTVERKLHGPIDIENVLGPGDLSHGAVKRGVPAFVITKVARSTRV